MQRAHRLLVVVFLFSTSLSASLVKTLPVSPGKLGSLLTDVDRKTLTHLTLTDTMDARDFVHVKTLEALTYLDLSDVTVVAYQGLEGTDELYNDDRTQLLPLSYPAGTLPTRALENMRGLDTLFLPASIACIGTFACNGCVSLTSIAFPESLEAIGRWAFLDVPFETVFLPARLSELGSLALSVTGEWRVDPKNTAFRTIDGILFNASGNELVHFPSGRQGAYVLPETVERLADGAFNGSSLVAVTLNEGLRSIGLSVFANGHIRSMTVPSTVDSIQSYCFANSALLTLTLESRRCYIGMDALWTPSLKRVILQSANPDNLNLDYALMGDFSQLVLCVPKGAVSAYQASWSNWSSFGWITDTYIYEIQTTAGHLADDMGEVDKGTLMDLVLKGTLNAVDFKVIRDELPNLMTLDMGAADVVAYSGTEGTGGSDLQYYAEGEFPTMALMRLSDEVTLTTVVLPKNVTRMGDKSLYFNRYLTALSPVAPLTHVGDSALAKVPLAFEALFPELTFIGERAFEDVSFKQLVLSDQQLPLKRYALKGSSADSVAVIITADTLPYACLDGVVKKGLYLSPSIKHLDTYSLAENELTSLALPPHLESIGESALSLCSKLTRVVFPSSLKRLDTGALAGCRKLQSIKVNAMVPPEVYPYTYVFYRVNKDECALVVPKGAAEAYREAVEWSDFSIIREFEPTLSLAVETLHVSDKGEVFPLGIYATTEWRAAFDTTCLSVFPVEGTDSAQVTVSILPNVTDQPRTLKVQLVGVGVPERELILLQGGVNRLSNPCIHASFLVYTLVSDVLTLREATQGQLSVFSLDGRCVLRQRLTGNSLVSITGVLPGYYVAKLTSGVQTMTQGFVVR